MGLDSCHTLLGTAIRAARNRQEITLRAFAGKMQISASLLSLIEQDEHVPPKELIVRIAMALGENADFWCGLAGKVTPEVEKSLARMARRDPQFFRTVLHRIGGE